MTREEKAKAYDEALERARKQRDEYQKEFDKTDKNSRLASILRAAISAVEMAFPELQESEDERVRKWILEKVQGYAASGIPCSDEIKMADRAIDYLIKQKEKARNITANLLEDGITGVQRELIEFLAKNIDASWVDVIKSADAYAQRIKSMFETQKDSVSNAKYIEDVAHAFEDGRKKGIEEKQKEQKSEEKPINWTELTWEDINYLEDLMAKVHYEFRNGIGAESFGKEVLEKFREYKEDEDTDEKEQKPIEPSDDELERHQKELHNFKVFAAKQAKEYHISFVHDFEWNNFCAELLSYFHEQKPIEWNNVTINGESIPTENHSVDIPLAEWNEEDEKTIDDAYCWLCEYAGSLIQKNYGKSSMLYGIANKLKFLRPQKLDVSKLENFDPVEVLHRIKKEWPMAWKKVVPMQMLSEEETKDLVHILKVLDDCYIYGQHDLSKTDYDNLTSTIKSLKPSWKPSEHQMTILKAVKDYVGVGSGYWGEALGSLIDDLEKLM